MPILKVSDISENGRVFTCPGCGTVFRIELPMDVLLYAKLLEAFQEVHAPCQPKEQPSQMTQRSIKTP